MATTRRNLLASALATTVTAGPALALAVAAAPVDPIFAKLDAQSKAKAAFHTACEERNTLAATLSPAVTRMSPSVLWDNEKFCRHDRIDSEIDRHIAMSGGSRISFSELEHFKRISAQLEKKRAELHAALDADAAMLERAQDAAGLTAKQTAVRMASDAEAATSMALTNTVPTTIAGAVAALEYHNRPSMPGTEYSREPDERVATIIRGLKSLV